MHVMRHFSFFQLVHACFSRKLDTFGGDILGTVRWVYIFLLEKKEGEKKLKRETLR